MNILGNKLVEVNFFNIFMTKILMILSLIQIVALASLHLDPRRQVSWNSMVKRPRLIFKRMVLVSVMIASQIQTMLRLKFQNSSNQSTTLTRPKQKKSTNQHEMVNTKSTNKQCKDLKKIKEISLSLFQLKTPVK